MTQRALFRACLAALDLPVGQAARRLGVSMNHLQLVLEGQRHPSERLRRDIETIIREAAPPLIAALREFAPPRDPSERAAAGRLKEDADAGMLRVPLY